MSSVIRFVPRHLRTSRESMARWLYGASERVRAASDREYARTGFPTTGRRFRLHDTAQRMRDAADWLMDVASAAALPIAEELTLEEELKLILWDGAGPGDLNHPYLTVRLIPSGGYEIVFGQMYEAPEFGLRQMKALAELFGVADEDLDVDNYSQGGCETCDYYSKYGHEVQLRNVTKRGAELKALVGRELLEPRSP